MACNFLYFVVCVYVFPQHPHSPYFLSRIFQGLLLLYPSSIGQVLLDLPPDCHPFSPAAITWPKSPSTFTWNTLLQYLPPGLVLPPCLFPAHYTVPTRRNHPVSKPPRDLISPPAVKSKLLTGIGKDM